MAEIRRMPVADFVNGLEKAWKRGDGYIMGATGQNPKKWKENSWWYTQYNGDQKKKALYWREHAQRVWDCNGLAEGLYKDFSGIDINTKARNNYSQWCGEKGTGSIPKAKRTPGAAVFIYSKSAGYITHVGYLYKPVSTGKPEGDWYVIEARGVMYGVVRTRLSQRGWNRWGLMTKYFDYGNSSASSNSSERILENGCEGDDVKALQENLLELGYDLGKYGADGDFGDATEMAVRDFQKDHGCGVDGQVGPETRAAIEKALSAGGVKPDAAKTVKITGGNCYVRAAPNTSGKILGVVKNGTTLPYGGQTAANGWLLVAYENQNGWVSGKYGKMEG